MQNKLIRKTSWGKVQENFIVFFTVTKICRVAPTAVGALDALDA